MKRLLPLLLLILLTACVSADPTLVARAVDATLAAVPTTTPIVVVITAVNDAPIATVTADANSQATLIAATQTLGAPVSTSVQLNASTPTPSATPAPVVTVTPTVSATSTSLAALVGPPDFVGASIFTDDFTQPQLWPASEDSTQQILVTNGQLSITLKLADRFTLIYDIKRRASKFYASVIGTSGACRFRDRYGLLFRLQGPSDYYQFEVDCDGRYRLAKIVGGNFTALQDWTPNAAINKGAESKNTLGIRAQGPTLQGFVNGVPLAEVTDSAFAEGGFGLYAGAGLSTTYTATFDDLQVWELKP